MMQVVFAIVYIASADRQKSPYDAIVRNNSLCDAQDSTVNVAVTQTAHAAATVSMLNEKGWSFMWIEDNSHTVLAYLPYSSTEASSGEEAGYTLDWTALDWTSDPEGMRAFVRFHDCSVGSSAHLDTWKGALDRWRSDRSKYDKSQLPADLKDDATWSSYTPVVHLDYANKHLNLTARLGDGNGTNNVAYVDVSCQECGYRGRAFLLFEAIGEGEDGHYVSEAVPFPPLTERLEVCVAVVYTFECVTYNLVDLLVEEMEASYTPVEQPSASTGEVSGVSASSSVLKVRATASCDATPHYRYVKHGDMLLAHRDGGGMLTVTVGADVASVQAFVQCGAAVAYSTIDVATPRAEALAALADRDLQAELERAGQKEQDIPCNASGPVLFTGAKDCASGDSAVAAEASGSLVGLGLGLGLGVPLVLGVGGLIFYSRRKKSAPPAPQTPPPAGEEGGVAMVVEATRL